ncbi:MAG TPA: tetratricopeptide repeat protein [Longimicrobiales bacterium]|nr:tetratricopeptide repeat protein [Longimicrobiales bacterium]
MIEADRILEPVAPDAPTMRALREYGSAPALADALRGASDAVEQSLRLLLRADQAADEQDRMRAMSPTELPFSDLIERLRARDRISIELAGSAHELRRAVESGTHRPPGPADADRALEVVARLRREVNTLGDAAVREAAHQGVAAHRLDEPATEVPGPERADEYRLRMAGVATTLVALAVAVFLVLRGHDDALEEGVEAFAAGDLTEAAAHFREAVADDPDEATPRLYLGRVYRRLGRHAEAGDQLERAIRIASQDADIRREMGYLFLDLEAHAAAVRQFEQAVELEPAEEAGWIGLVRAMRLAGDARAEAMLARAPAAAQALLSRETTRAPTLDTIE